MENQKQHSGILCVRRLFSQYRQNVNFSALVTDDLSAKLETDPASVIVGLAAEQNMRPEKTATFETFNSYKGPALLRLQNGGWIIICNSAQWMDGEEIAIYDPSVNEDSELLVPKPEIAKCASDEIIVFRNLAQVDVTQQTRLFCLSAIVRHNNVQMDLNRVMHEYAVTENEVTESEFIQIAEDYKFKAKSMKLSYEKLMRCNDIFPLVGVKHTGKYVVVCGIRTRDDGGRDVVVLDPENESEEANHFQFFEKEKYDELLTNKYILLKKIYKLSDESQPFSLAWFIPEFLKLKGVFGQIAMLVATLTILSLVIPLFFQIVVDKVLANHQTVTLNSIGIGVIIAILLNGVMEYARSYLLLFATNKIDIATATKTFLHLMHLPIDFFERVPSGVLLKHMQQTERIRGFLSGNLFFTLLDLVSLCIFIPFLLFYSVHLTLIVLGFSALMAIVIACLIKPFQRRLDELYQAEGKRQSMLVEAIHGVRTVKSLALEPVEEKVWNDSTAYAIKSYFRVGKISMAARSISQVLEMAMTVCVIWFGALMVFDNIITVGALIAFQMLANRVTGPLVKMVGLIHEYQQIALSVRMLGVVMNTPLEPNGGGVRNPLRGKIEFENVSFQYRPDLPQVIKNFNLSISEGTTVGFVGRSGSGKTTLTKLLQGLYPVTQGVIKIDGIDIREIDKTHLRSSIGVVLQENYFFSGTVRENISLTKRNASLEEILYASKLAGADEFVQKLPRGYDTVLEENASNLSGGQKQRLAIARALLTNPPILIFDEATSALDPESECVIQQNLKAIANGRTVLIVSHRLSIVSHSDNIVVINAGEQSATGTHRELLDQPGIYHDFWAQQMRGDE